MRLLHNGGSIPTYVLSLCYQEMKKTGALPKPELLEKVVSRCAGDVTTTDANKATILLLKAGLMKRSNTKDEYLWQVSPVPETDMLYAVDKAMIVRLLVGLEEMHIPLDINYLSPLFLVKRTDKETKQLIDEAKRMSRNGNDQE